MTHSEDPEGQTPTERFLARMANGERFDTGWSDEYASVKQAEIEALERRAALAMRGAGAIGEVPEDTGP